MGHGGHGRGTSAVPALLTTIETPTGRHPDHREAGKIQEQLWFSFVDRAEESVRRTYRDTRPFGWRGERR